MAYVGRGLTTGANYQKLDAVTVDNTTTFTMAVNGTAVTPAAEHVILAVNGVIQEPNVGFTVSGSTCTLASAIDTNTAPEDTLWGVIAGNAAYVNNEFGSAVTHKNTVTVGEDDTGYDVKFFGATSGKYMLWDESADELIVSGNLTVSGKGGNLFQVVSEVDSNQASSTSNSFAAKANPSPSITTTVLNSRILVIGSTFVSNAGGDRCMIDLVRDVSGGSTTTGISGESRGLANHQPTDADSVHTAFVFLDSPTVAAGTTITYQFCFKNGDNSSTQYLGHADVESTLTLMEVV